jgi:O-antigen ligase
MVLLARDRDALSVLPHVPLAICAAITTLGVFQILPLPFAIAEKFNPTVDLMRPLIPHLGLDHPPAVSWSVAAPETTDALLRFVAYVLLGLATAVAFHTERSRRRIALVLVTSGVFQALYGSGEYLTGRQHIFGFAKKYYLDSATGTLINRNHFATLLVVALPFALTLATPHRTATHERGWRERLIRLSKGPGLTRVFAILASALIWMGLLLSHSRAGLVAGIAAAAIAVVRPRGERAIRWTAAIGMAVFLVLLSAELAQAPGERLLTVKDDIEAKGGRLTVWRDATALIATRPILGWGFGTFASAFPMVQSERIEQLYDHAHNDWVEWTTEGGVVALLAAVALVGLALRATWSRTTDPESKAFGAACRAALIAVALHSLWDFSLRIPAVATAVSVLMGLAFGLGSGSTFHTPGPIVGWPRSLSHGTTSSSLD